MNKKIKYFKLRTQPQQTHTNAKPITHDEWRGCRKRVKQYGLRLEKKNI